MFFETLENRKLMSGVTAAQDAAGNLTVVGSSGDDAIGVTTGTDTNPQDANYGRSFAIVQETNSGYFQWFWDTTSVKINGNGGNDNVEYYGNIAAQITTGNGSDQVTIWDFSSTGATVDTGNGNDFIDVQQASVGGTTILNGGNGDDNIQVFSDGGNVAIDGGNGSDQIIVQGTGAAVNGTINGGNGNKDSVIAINTNTMITGSESTLVA